MEQPADVELTPKGNTAVTDETFSNDANEDVKFEISPNEPADTLFPRLMRITLALTNARRVFVKFVSADETNTQFNKVRCLSENRQEEMVIHVRCWSL